MFVIGFINHEGKKVYVKRGQYPGSSENVEDARVFNKIGHVKNWRQGSARNCDYFVQKLEIKLGDIIPIKDIYHD